MKPVRKSVIVFIIFILAITVRLSHYSLYHGMPLGQPLRHEAVAIAKSLHKNGTFADAFGDGTGPTAHTTPAYPLFLASVFGIFGENSYAYTAIRIVTCMGASISYAMLPKVATILGFSWTAGTFGGLVGALVPYSEYEIGGEFENVLSVTAFLIFIVLVQTQLKKPERALTPGLIIGLGIGFMALFAASLLPAIAVVVADTLRKRTSILTFQFCFTIVFSASILVAPWVFRNYSVFHTFIPLRGNFWLEVAVSNQEGASPTFERNFLTLVYQNKHPNNNDEIRDHYVQIGERDFMIEMRSEAVSWILAHKNEFAVLSLKRLWNVLFFDFPNRLLTLYCAVVALFGIVGAIIRRERGGFHEQHIGFWKLVFALSAVHIVVQVSARYRYPLHILMLVPFGGFIETAIGWYAARGKLSSERVVKFLQCTLQLIDAEPERQRPGQASGS